MGAVCVLVGVALVLFVRLFGLCLFSWFCRFPLGVCWWWWGVGLRFVIVALPGLFSCLFFRTHEITKNNTHALLKVYSSHTTHETTERNTWNLQGTYLGNRRVYISHQDT